MTPVWFKCIVQHICRWQHLHVLSPVAAKWYRAIVNLHSWVVVLPQRDEEVYPPWRDTAPAHLEEVAQHLYQMFPGCLPREVFWSWEDHGEGPGHPGVICHSARLGMPWDPATRAGGIVQGTGSPWTVSLLRLLSPDNVPDGWKGRKKQVEVRCA